MKSFKSLAIIGVLSLMSIMAYGLHHLTKHSKFNGLVNNAINTLQEISPMVEKKNNMLSRAKYTQDGYNQAMADVNQEIMNKLQKAKELIDNAMQEVSVY